MSTDLRLRKAIDDEPTPLTMTIQPHELLLVDSRESVWRITDNDWDPSLLDDKDRYVLRALVAYVIGRLDAYDAITGGPST